MTSRWKKPCLPSGEGRPPLPDGFSRGDERDDARGGRDEEGVNATWQTALP
ncbi:hypothetical protein [Streptomyces sp. NBC_01233]|uniref:hypothetical protein n=1 Tax=Streptomyces sp. NBC_01233 TaxID=2903787 RepID=UPI002E1462B7|nr:hypothetical protein OG332_14240 [Streptomyces sp. NBC_01233]